MNSIETSNNEEIQEHYKKGFCLTALLIKNCHILNSGVTKIEKKPRSYFLVYRFFCIF